MACVGLGVDIVVVERFTHIVGNRGSRFLDRLFTPAECHYCDEKMTRYEAYSARFAAKEAFLKALGMGLRGGLNWRDIEIVNDRFGKPELKVSGEAEKVTADHGVKKISVSMSHSGGFAIAVVILEN